jgi:hypothetical protein
MGPDTDIEIYPKTGDTKAKTAGGMVTERVA